MKESGKSNFLHSLSNKWNGLTKKERWGIIRNFLLMILGSFVLAFGNAAFIVPSDLVTGGVSSIGVIVQFYLDEAGIGFEVVDIVTAALTVGLFLIGLFVLGKKFSAHTFLASVLYPAFFALLYRTELLAPIYNSLLNAKSEPMIGMLLCAIFGGIFVGAGVAITFKGNGSTGGVDILCAIIAKYTPIKESFTSATIDCSLVVIGMICRYSVDNSIALGLIGILSALTAAAMIQIVYVASNSFVLCDVISSKYESIIEFIQNDLDRGCTLLNTTGGYTGEDRLMVRAALSKSEAQELKKFIAKVDPKAFLTMVDASAVNGEGFAPIVYKRRKKKADVANLPIEKGENLTEGE